MRKQLRTEFAQNVAEKLVAAETAMDRAVAQVYELTSTVLNGRIDANLSACEGQEAVRLVGKVGDLAFSARQTLVEAHAALAASKIQIGLRETNLGDGTGCPPLIAETHGAESNSVVVRLAA